MALWRVSAPLYLELTQLFPPCDGDPKTKAGAPSQEDTIPVLIWLCPLVGGLGDNRL